MTENLLNALEITVIGMGLVFGVLILLWGVITVLVRFLADRPASTPAPELVPALELSDSGAHRRKQQAALAAVAVALALAREAEAVRPIMQGAAISPWQSAMRGRQSRERGRRR